MTPGRLFAYGRPESLAGAGARARACTPDSCRTGWRRAPRPSTSRVNRAPTLAAIGLGQAAIQALLQPDRAAHRQRPRWLQAAPNRSLVTWGSAEYPPLLAQIPDAPLVLYVEGDATALCLPQLAIVGSRNPTALGRDTATQFALHLAQAGLAITSGLALGIDAAAHRGALNAGARTVAVVGRGLDAVYPRENAALAREIVERQGALVTDLPVGTPPLKQNFPRRNRILSGLAVGTLVVEAALQSGSLITARLAARPGPRSLCHSRVHPQPDGPGLPPPAAPGRAAGRERG